VLDPVSVALKFGFLAVLYLFLLWVARSALKDLRGAAAPRAIPTDATGFHPAVGLPQQPEAEQAPQHGPAPRHGPARLRVERAAGLEAGSAFDVSTGAVLGRGEGTDIRLEDAFASTRHAQIVPEGSALVLEDLGSTNGTYLNGAPLHGPVPLHPGDHVRIGETEFTFEH